MVLNRALASRAATHLAAWLPFLYGAASAMRHGWRPVSDDAGIAIRSWDVLTSYGPLVGQPSRLARGVYDPGPLQYWLLTIPVHIDPRAGALWGAALWCMLACSLAIEAARSAAGAAGGLLAAGTLIGAALWIPDIARRPLWNPWFGLLFFLAALAAAWAVFSGRRGWWPVLVITASIASQAHLMYAIASASLVLVALIAGLAETIRARAGLAGYRWLITGVIAGLFAWSAPLLQEFTARHGNLSALLSNTNGGAGPKGGLTFGFQALAASIQPPAVWFTPLPRITTLSVVSSRPMASGVVALVLIAAVLIAALWLRSRRTAAVAGVSLLVSLAALITYAAVPAANISLHSTAVNNVTYLMAPMLAVGITAWTTVAAGVVLAARRLTGREAAPAAEPTAAPAAVLTPRPAGGSAVEAASRPVSEPAPTGRLARAAPAAAIASACVIALASLLAISEQRSLTNSEQRSPSLTNASVAASVPVAVQKVQAKLPGEAVTLTVVGHDHNYRRRMTFALAYALTTLGYRPEVEQKFAWQLGPAFSYTGRQVPAVTVHTRKNDLRLRQNGLWVSFGLHPPA